MKNVTTILMILISCSILGQEINTEIGNPYKSSAMVENIIGVYGNKLYTQSYTLGSNGLKEYKIPMIQGFNVDGFGLLFENKIELPKIGSKKVELLEIIMTANGPVAIGYQSIKSTGQISIVGYSINSSGNLILPEIKIMESFDEQKMKWHDVFVEMSEDKTKILLGYLRMDSKLQEYHTNIVVMDDELQELSSQEIITDYNPFKDKESRFNLSVHLDNDGSYISMVDQTIFYKKTLPDYSFIITEYSKTGELLNSITHRYPEKGVYKPSVFFNDEEKTFRIIGFYSELKKPSIELPGYSGIYNAVVERGTLKIIDQLNIPFTEGLLVKIFGSKEYNKNKSKENEIYIPEYLKINEILANDYGELIITAEFYSEQIRGERFSWYFGDIVVLKISEEGAFSWAEVVYKKQLGLSSKVFKTNYSYRTTGSGINYYYVNNSLYKGMYGALYYSQFVEPEVNYFWSYIPLIDQENIHIIFNDYVERPDNSSCEKPYLTPKKCIPFEVIIDGNGELTKTPMSIPNMPESHFITPKISYKISDNEYIIWTMKLSSFVNEHAFGKVFIE